MMILMFLFAVLLATGLFFIIADIVKLPTIAATKALINTRKQDKKLSKTIEAWLMVWAVKASRFVRMDEYRRSRMKNILKASGMRWDILPPLSV